MHAPGRRANGSSKSRIARLWPRAVVVLALALLALDSLAQDAQADTAPASFQQPTAGLFDRSAHAQLQLSGTTLPRFENTDGASRRSRLDFSLMPPGQSALGFAMGVTTADSSSFGPAGLAPNTPAIDLGLRWRYITGSNGQVDVSAWRRMPPSDALSLVQTREANYGARVEMRVAPVAKPGFVADHGFLGLQLESGARITLRRNGGKPMMYYRSTF